LNRTSICAVGLVVVRSKRYKSSICLNKVFYPIKSIKFVKRMSEILLLDFLIWKWTWLWFGLCCDIEILKYDFIIFQFWKLLFYRSWSITVRDKKSYMIISHTFVQISMSCLVGTITFTSKFDVWALLITIIDIWRRYTP